jgi:hypothetical protein
MNPDRSLIPPQTDRACLTTITFPMLVVFRPALDPMEIQLGDALI